MNEPIEPGELQRLLDGRLSADERELLLAQAEQCPENWRTIALAFVEEQVLREVLGDLTAQGKMDMDIVLSEKQPAVAGGRAKWSRLAQAAAVLLVLGVGAAIGRFGWAPTAEDAGGYVMLAWPESPASAAVDAAPAKLTSQDTWQSAAQLLSTPLFDEESRRVFQRHGFTVSEEPVIYMVKDRGGEHYVIPHRRASLRYDH
ncbi:MAG: hypothetical protein MI861_25145 [Pirellulales bacterium]|nr:hypothetical protein [Pirellulales bacterium]